MAPSGRERAYTFVKKEVLTDPSMQGTFINEQALADRIGVSRTPIREALLMLAAQDLLRLVPKRGAYIAPMSNRELTDLVAVRTMIEKHSVFHILDFQSTMDEMQDVLATQNLLRRKPKHREFIELDMRFHTTLVRSNGNEILTRMYEGLRDRQVTAGMIALARNPDRQEAVLDEHARILNALVACDFAAAAQAIEDHLKSTLRVQLG
ncbi:GntR family transcriptional regulator [Actinocrispum sp. NPDC049592]|uniref:GntR family transcriptional regulator n=1 Tax=Actinocrispum sp. NPDC049592 TaxID=3154835 RepID=UPI003424CEC2